MKKIFPINENHFKELAIAIVVSCAGLVLVVYTIVAFASFLIDLFQQ